MSKKRHVFLSYHSSIYGELASIHDLLTASGFRVFPDRRCIPAGMSREKEIDKAVATADSVLIVIGPGGAGPWREKDNYAFRRIAAAVSHKVIPVFLPGAALPDDCPAFLNRCRPFFFKSSVNDELPDLVRLLPGDSLSPGHGSLAVRESGLSASTRKFYETNAEIYLNRWHGPVPPEIYPWFFLMARR